MRGGRQVVIEPHRHEGIFIARGKEDALVTRNTVPGEAVYGEKRISVEVIKYAYIVHCVHVHVYGIIPVYTRLQAVLALTKLSIEFGIPSGANWQLPFWVELTKSTWVLGARFSILGPPQEPQYLMCRILLAR